MAATPRQAQVYRQVDTVASILATWRGAAATWPFIFQARTACKAQMDCEPFMPDALRDRTAWLGM